MSAGESSAATFESDVAFLKQHTDVLVLTSEDGTSRVAVAPAYQGRVMTSSARGAEGLSMGWLNHEHIASGEVADHINVYGGEDRFWLGPEGGQFSIFFKGGEPFDLEHWQTPAAIDTMAYDVVSRDAAEVVFGKAFSLENYSGTEFAVRVERTIRLLTREATRELLGADVPDGLSLVAYQSDNRITNAGSDPWTKQTGLLSIWILGMFNPSDRTTIVVPFQQGPEDELGPVVNDSYFGNVPADRLVVKEGVLFFSGDGKYRSKIGLTPQRALAVAGSYDAVNGILTLVHYDKPAGVLDYVNSMWELQDEPYRGDTVNSYNDGPPAPGQKPLGPFYELETSSPAAALAPGEHLQHVHSTFHFQGTDAELNALAKQALGVGLDEITGAFTAQAAE